MNTEGLKPSKELKHSLNELKGEIDNETFAFILLHHIHNSLGMPKNKIQEILNSAQLDLN